MKSRVYHVRCRWRSGYFLARSSLHAIALATERKLHKTGRAVIVEEVSPLTLGDDIERAARAGETGFIKLPPFVVLIYREVTR